jgi:MATE family multidrug resistance protein
MIKLALPGMVMIEAQFFALEILTLAASQFGSAHLAAQSILVTMTSTTFNIPFPLSIAASTRVANLIGARLSDAARMSAKVVCRLLRRKKRAKGGEKKFSPSPP